MNGLFIGTFIYADDITIIAPSCYALNSMLNICEEYALSHGIIVQLTENLNPVLLLILLTLIHHPYSL